MSILNTFNGGGGVNQPFAWIEYNQYTTSTQDYTQVLQSSFDSATTTIVAHDITAGPLGGYCFNTYANWSQNYGQFLLSTPSSTYMTYNIPCNPTPGWVPTDCNYSATKTAYWMTRAISYSETSHLITIEYTKSLYFGTKYVTQIDKNNVIRIHLTEQTGEQYKKVPLV